MLTLVRLVVVIVVLCLRAPALAQLLHVLHLPALVGRPLASLHDVIALLLSRPLLSQDHLL